MSDLLLTTNAWTEVTGLTEGSKYNIQCLSAIHGNLEPFYFTQNASAPDKFYKAVYALAGVAFKKGSSKAWIKSTKNVNVHIEEIQ